MREYTDRPGHIVLKFYKVLVQVLLARSETTLDI